MSLNRRVYAWLLGPGEFPSNYSWKAHPGCEAIRELLYPNTQLAVDLTRAYKVMVSLLDHPVLGPALLAEVFEDFLRSWHQHSKYLLDSTATEVILE
jgi:hypothetical protein